MSSRAEVVQQAAESRIGDSIQNAKTATEQWPDNLGGPYAGVNNTKKFKKEIRRSLSKIKGKVFGGELDEAYDIIDVIRDKVVTWVPEGSSGKERFLRSLNNIEKAIDTGIWRSSCCCCCSNTQGKTTKSSKEEKKKEQRKR